PSLPVRHLEALDKLRLGSYDHIAFEIPGNPLELENDQIIYEKASNERTGALIGNMLGTSLCMIDIGGSFGGGLAALGEAAMIIFGIGWLSNLFGNSIKSAIKRRHATQWTWNPWVRGSFSSAAPGHQPARRALGEPLNDRLWFAGEATNVGLWGC